MKLVIDASVAVKWFFSDDPAEHDTDKAIDLLTGLYNQRYDIRQPAHWLLEVYAVVVRRSAANAAQEALGILHALELEVVDHIAIHELAGTLSQQYQHHLFDTLYHAVAIETDSLLITADEKYWQKAKAHGHIELLQHLKLTP
jgi:predicted nucleic acid-binding protein